MAGTRLPVKSALMLAGLHEILQKGFCTGLRFSCQQLEPLKRAPFLIENEVSTKRRGK
jgi:hypothetical protein